MSHVIVNAGAGTGKTFVMEGAANLLRGTLDPTICPSDEQAAIWDAIGNLDPTWSKKNQPQYITCCAFNKSIATTLQERMPRGVKAGTLHSFGYGTIKFATRSRFLKVSDWKNKDFVLDRWDKDIRELNQEERDQLRYVEQLVTLSKMTMAGTYLSTAISTDEANHPVHTHVGCDLGDSLDCDVTNEELEALCARFAIAVNGSEDVFDLVRYCMGQGRKMTKKIDFADMIWLPVVNGYQPFRSDLLMVDEAQDLNTCQQALTRMMGEHRVYVGDVNQAIYGFSGSDSESFASLTDQCDEDGGVEELPLMETRRCGKAIVEHAQQWVPDYTAHESNPAGIINHLSQEKAMLEYMIDNMILCRTNAPLVSLAFRLLGERRPVAIQGRDIGKGLINLLKSFKQDDVSELGPMLDDWYAKEEQKIMKRPRASETALQALEDKVKCCQVFMEHHSTLDEVVQDIDSVFDDNTKGRIRLSSVHRGKGLEADNVYIIEPQLMPHPMASQSWERVQERNLQYVAATRAINNLNYVEGTPA